MAFPYVLPMTSHGAAADQAGTVAADDLRSSVLLARAALRGVPDDAWGGQAAGLEWDRWETVEHLCDDLFSYALQIGPGRPPLDTHVPLAWERRRPGGPPNAIFVDRAAGPPGLLEVLEACGSILVAMVRVTSPQVRAYHVYGASDPAGFAAMGIVETLVHTYDVVTGLDLAWSPPGEVCERTLRRLFPEAPTDQDPWGTLLWATGRAELPGKARLTDWRWDGRPRSAR